MIEEGIAFECVSRIIGTNNGSIFSNPLLRKLQSKCDPISKDINRLFSRLLHENMAKHQDFSSIEISNRFSDIQGRPNSSLG